MLPIFTPQQLAQEAKKDELIQKTAQQIIKDFAEFGFEVTFSGKPDNFYPELFTQLESCLGQLLGTDFHRLMSLLYRIDISAKEVASYESQMPELNNSHILATLVIHRELKKVLTREYFKTH